MNSFLRIFSTNENINDVLPPHIIVQILSNLDLRDLKNAILTCFDWYNLSLMSPRLKQKLSSSIKLSRMELVPAHPLIISIIKSRREINSVTLNTVTLNWLYRDFWEKVGETITQFNLVNCRLSLENLIEIFQHLPRLRSLELNNSLFGFVLKPQGKQTTGYTIEEMALYYLSKLQTLKVIMMPQQIFKTLFIDLKSLKSFSYENISGQFNFDKPTMLEFISSNALTLEHLTLVYDKTDESIVGEIAQIKELNLKVFETNNLKCKLSEFELLCNNNPRVERFEGHDATVELVKTAVKRWPNLNSITLNTCDEATLLQLKELQHLKDLHLENIGELPKNVLVDVLQSIDPDMLQTFTFEGFLSDADMEWIVQRFRNLRELRLSCMRPIPLSGMQLIFKYSLDLEVLILSRWSWFYRGIDEQIEPRGYCISNLRKLQVLILNGIPSFPGTSEEAIAQLPNLQHYKRRKSRNMFNDVKYRTTNWFT